MIPPEQLDTAIPGLAPRVANTGQENGGGPVHWQTREQLSTPAGCEQPNITWGRIIVFSLKFIHWIFYALIYPALSEKSLTCLPRVPWTKVTSVSRLVAWPRHCPAPWSEITATISKSILQPHPSPFLFFLTRQTEYLLEVLEKITSSSEVVSPSLCCQCMTFGFPSSVLSSHQQYTCHLNDLGQGQTIYCQKYQPRQHDSQSAIYCNITILWTISIKRSKSVMTMMSNKDKYTDKDKVISNQFGRGQGSCNCTAHPPIRNLLLKRHIANS